MSAHSNFDHNSPKFRADPLPYYKRLRKAGVGRTEHYGGIWLVPTYEEVQAVSHDLEDFSPAKGAMVPPMTDRPLLP
ncbi:MAG TPA: hypothetical protein DIW45_09860, partial [Erythrobacter sp.]|nr:hypothetical protein [Erythrobacter sp.]